MGVSIISLNRKHFQSIAKWSGFDDISDFALDILKKSKRERKSVLSDYYSNQDDDLKNIFSESSQSGGECVKETEKTRRSKGKYSPPVLFSWTLLTVRQSILSCCLSEHTKINDKMYILVHDSKPLRSLMKIIDDLLSVTYSSPRLHIFTSYFKPMIDIMLRFEAPRKYEDFFAYLFMPFPGVGCENWLYIVQFTLFKHKRNNSAKCFLLKSFSGSRQW